jgi:hypothetical protein
MQLIFCAQRFYLFIAHFFGREGGGEKQSTVIYTLHCSNTILMIFLVHWCVMGFGRKKSPESNVRRNRNIVSDPEMCEARDDAHGTWSGELSYSCFSILWNISTVTSDLNLRFANHNYYKNNVGWETVRNEPLHWMDLRRSTVDSGHSLHPKWITSHPGLVLEDFTHKLALRKFVSYQDQPAESIRCRSLTHSTSRQDIETFSEKN